MKLSEIQKAHFIGVGGIGMSGLARLFLGEGKTVSGSDRSPSDITEALSSEGVVLFDSQVAENISDDINLVVYTEAMPKDHEELVAAREKGIRTVNYFEALGMVANEYYLIAVAGTHGKSTTTAMLIDIFEMAGLDPSAIVGALRRKTKSNYRKGKSKYFIVEACEYKRDFMSLEPDILVITNIEHEHVDYYPDLASVQSAFHDLALKVPKDGFVIANTKDENIIPVLEGVEATITDYTKYFNPLRTLTMPGVHNQMNAAAAIAAALQCGISVATAERTLQEFGGTWRRFEYKGEVKGLSAGAGAKVYDDYGHHPTEIVATLKGARELYPDKRLIVVFQSHTYTRTLALFDEFIDAIALADQSVILPIYAAREVNETGISNTKLAAALVERGNTSISVDSVEAAVSLLEAAATEKDVIITMGAGDMTPQVANALIS